MSKSTSSRRDCQTAVGCADMPRLQVYWISSGEFLLQATEMCCIFMYLLWVFEFFKGLMCIGRRGYQSCACQCDAKLSYVWNRLEQEAFDHQRDLHYLEHRPCFAWCAYPTRSVAEQWMNARRSQVWDLCKALQAMTIKAMSRLSLVDMLWEKGEEKSLGKVTMHN